MLKLILCKIWGQYLLHWTKKIAFNYVELGRCHRSLMKKKMKSISYISDDQNWRQPLIDYLEHGS